ncbi:hypothetical protein Tco_0327106 [Tanacetum coccineum]
MSTPTQCCDMGSDGYAYPVYMQNEVLAWSANENVMAATFEENIVNSEGNIESLQNTDAVHSLQNNQPVRRS